MSWMTSAGSNSRSSTGCHGSSNPTRREASYSSSSLAQRSTSCATSSPKRQRTSSKERRRRPPRAVHLTWPVFGLYGRKPGSPSRLTSCRIPSASGRQPPCRSPASRAAMPRAATRRSSRRPATLVGMQAPRHFACSATDRAASTLSCSVRLCASVGPSNSSTKPRRSRSSAFSLSSRSTRSCKSSSDCACCTRTGPSTTPITGSLGAWGLSQASSGDI
mmetsp:Transcript_46344/g.108594  ORF Transcript_46344/g.108594 Transcript_46344/m.108594 type:complete len:219 (-) Transcript_46344:74-730(-)